MEGVCVCADAYANEWRQRGTIKNVDEDVQVKKDNGLKYMGWWP